MLSLKKVFLSLAIVGLFLSSSPVFASEINLVSFVAVPDHMPLNTSTPVTMTFEFPNTVPAGSVITVGLGSSFASCPTSLPSGCSQYSCNGSNGFAFTCNTNKTSFTISFNVTLATSPQYVGISENVYNGWTETPLLYEGQALTPTPTTAPSPTTAPTPTTTQQQEVLAAMTTELTSFKNSGIGMMNSILPIALGLLISISIVFFLIRAFRKVTHL